MLPDSCDEIFKTAYANVGLSSDTVWIAGVPDNFRKANQELWVQHSIVTNAYRNNIDNSNRSTPQVKEKARTVRVTIPFSRLAQYGDYEYNEDRERLYAPHNTSPQHKEDFHLPRGKNDLQSDSYEEAWMSPAVEEEFRRLTCVDSSEAHKLWTQQLTPFTPSRHGTANIEEESAPRRFLVFESWASILLTKYPKLARSIRNSQHQSLFSDDIAVPHRAEPFDGGLFPVPRYNLRSSEELQLQLRINSAEVREIWSRTTTANQSQESQLLSRASIHRRNAFSTLGPFNLNQSFPHRPPPPTLNADVPEFFPKTNVRSTSILNDDNENGRKYFPSARGISHQSELFPYAPNAEKITNVTSNINNDSGRTYTTAGISKCPAGITTFTTSGTTRQQQSNSQLDSVRQHAPPSSSILCRPPQQWFNTNFQQHYVSTLVYTQSQTSAPFSASSFSQETSTVLNNRRTSIPRSIPVYQRPPEFYTQHQDSTSNGNGTSSRRRQGGGGVDFSNLILLTKGSKSHYRPQNNSRQQQLSISQGEVEISLSGEKYRHLPVGPVIFGRDLFSDLPLRTVVHEKQECQNNNYLSLRREDRPLPEVSVSDQLPVIEETIENNDLNMIEPTITTSVLPWLDYNYPIRANELRNVNKLIEEFLSIETQLQQQTESEKEESETKQDRENPSNELTLMEMDHFPPIVAISPTKAASATVTTELTTPPQTTITSVIPRQDSSATSSPSAGSSDGGQPSVNVKRRLYRDVLTNSTTVSLATSPVTPVADNCLDRRFEELERQALEQYHPSEENLGQRFQQQRASEESISQRYQELERQAMEQYQCSSSSSSGSNDGCVAEASSNGSSNAKGDSGVGGGSSGGGGCGGGGGSGGSGGSGVGADVSDMAPTSELPICSGPEHCTSPKESLLGDDQSLSLPSGGAGSLSPLGQGNIPPNYLWTRGGGIGTGGGSNSIANKRGMAGLTTSQSQHEFPGAQVAASPALSTCVTLSSTTGRNRPAAASKSLPAIGSSVSPVTAEPTQAGTSLGAAGDKIGTGTAKSRRRLVLIKKQRPLQSPPEFADIEEEIVGPQLLVVASGVRGGGQSVTSGQTPRRLVAAIFDTPFQVTRSAGGSTRAEGARSSKSHTQQHHKESTLINRGAGGGGDEKTQPHQRNFDITNPNVQRTQVSAKSHSQSANNNERDLRHSVACNDFMAKTAGCLEIPEAWVHHYHCHKAGSSSNSDPLPPIAAANSLIDETKNNCTYEKEYFENSDIPSTTKSPPWMTKQRKKGPASGNKKKRNKPSAKRGTCYNKRLNEASSNYNLIVKQDSVGNKCNVSEEGYKNNANYIIAVQHSDTNHCAIEKQNEIKIIYNSLDNDKVHNDTNNCCRKELAKKIGIPANVSKYYSAKKSQSGLKLRKPKKGISDIEGLEKHSNDDSIGEESAIFFSKRRFNYVHEHIENNVQTIDHLIFLHLGNEEFNFRFQNSNLKPICMIPHDFHVQICPHKCMIEYFLNSEIENVLLTNCKVRIRWPNNFVNEYWNRGREANKESASAYLLTAQVLGNYSQLKMKQILKELQTPTLITSFYQNCARTTSASSFPWHEAKNPFYISKIPEAMSKTTKVENEYEPLRCLKYLQRSKDDIDIELAMKNRYILNMERNISEMSSVGCKLEPQSAFQKRHPEFSACKKKLSPVSREITAAFSWALGKVHCKPRKLILQPKKVRKSCSAPCVLSRNNYNKTQEPHASSSSHFQPPGVLPAKLHKKLSNTQTVIQDISHSTQNVIQLTHECEKQARPVHGMTTKSQTNLSVTSDITKAPTLWKVSPDEKPCEIGFTPLNIIKPLGLVKNKYSPEITQASEVSVTIGENICKSTSEIENTPLHIKDNVPRSNSATLQSISNYKNNIPLGQQAPIDLPLPLTQASAKVLQDLPLTHKARRSVTTVSSACTRQKKIKRTEETNSEFTKKNKHETTCRLQ